MIRNFVKHQAKKRISSIKFLKKFFIKIAKWQYSRFYPLRLIASVFVFPKFFFLQDDYYKLLIFSQKTQVEDNHKLPSRFLPCNFFIRAITNDSFLNTDHYSSFLSKHAFQAEVQYEWSKRFMEVGRLDLARLGLIELVNRQTNKLIQSSLLEAYRHLGAVCFMLGKNDESNYYWRRGGKLRRALFTPTTPKNYRILGPAWFAALGHIALLDYYIKFKKLNGETVRVVSPSEFIPVRELFNKFVEMGITPLTTYEIEADYNQWALQNKLPLWSQLSALEKAAMVDDFWEYDFKDGEILGYAYAAARIQKEWEAAKYPPLFVLTNKEKNWLKEYLLNLGLPPNAWYVCLHVREGGYHKQWNALYPSMRDSEVADYDKAIEQIVKAGGWVLRMGDPSMKPLSPMANVIDYAHSEFKTPIGDILLPAGARFLLGTNSGYASICTLYDVPCVLTNWVPIGWPLWPTQDLMMPKLFRYKNSDRYLTLVEIFQNQLAYLQNWSDLPKDIELVKNTPEEIENITMEMLAKRCPEANLKYVECGVTDNIQEYYSKVANYFGGFTGSRLSRSFVEKYPNVFAINNELTLNKVNKETPCQMMAAVPEVTT